ncbi:unnamed protein product [Miscanthus lutarioriparius]|uniref:Ammonium transporter AmtB-like domain-containing protein n=1 Tax=Miscanthus lutarioriparius TaxID=422564 RepID=A0A811PAE9_9POAL|nr:unnamed protein product [Miscanthus lutarioriparius]
MASPPDPGPYMPDLPVVPAWLNKGDNAWQMVAATFVGLQSMPGLVVLYGSIVKKKWAVNSAFMAMYAYASTLIVWVLVGFRMAFGERMLPFWAKAGPALTLWGGGFLYQWGVIDYSGGYVIHLSSGIAGFTAAYWVGPRLKSDRERFSPNNILLMIAGGGLLWLGWAGFNGGAPYAPNITASVAVLNTNVSAATSLLSWTCLDVIFFGKALGRRAGHDDRACLHHAGRRAGAHVVGDADGRVRGQRPVVHDDDPAQEILPAHEGARGVFYGGGIAQMVKQLGGALFVTVWNLVVTSVILLCIGLFIPLRMPDDQLMIGDDAAHGEEAYALLGNGEKFDVTRPDTTRTGGASGAPREDTVEQRLTSMGARGVTIQL